MAPLLGQIVQGIGRKEDPDAWAGPPDGSPSKLPRGLPLCGPANKKNLGTFQVISRFFAIKGLQFLCLAGTGKGSVANEPQN